MHVTCPRCQAHLEFAEKRPSFCSECGSSLSQPQPATTPYEGAEAPTLAPLPGSSAALPALREQVGGYRLLRRLGAGGMGSVYEAEEINSTRRVALKLISPEHATSPDAVERFRREGRLASTIAHPRCVFVLAADEDAGQPYIVMELMPGDTLETLVAQQGPLPPETAVAKVLDIIEGLQEAHRLGVVHRDMKPSNCFLEADGRVKVGDFGLAKSLVNQAHLTRTGSFLGTVLYASPEQIRGEPVDAQSDVYSVAATLYFLLAGRAPFQTGDPAATLARIVSDPVPPLCGARPEVTAGLEQVVLRGLERDRQRRYRNLDEFRAALLPFAPGRLSIGGVGLRFGAFLLDTLILLPLGWLDAGVIMWALTDPSAFIILRLTKVLILLVHFGYFAITEGCWGCTPGKRLMRLRVWRVGSNAPPGLLRGMARTGIYLLVFMPGFVAALWYAPHIMARNQVLNTEMTFLQVGLFLVGLTVLLSTMRARNGYRLLHDLLTRTRVVQLPERERKRLVPTFGWQKFERMADKSPDRMGGFVIRATLTEDANARVLLGEDPSLGRQTLLWLRSSGAPALNAARRSLSRPARCRWLTGGQKDHQHWDAFLAPTGCSVSQLVTANGKLSWADARPILEQLANELGAASAEGTLPERLEVRQVWVQPTGQVLLLDVPFGTTAFEGASCPETAGVEERMLSLLRRTAVLLLEGRPRTATERADRVRAPVPDHAQQMLRRLLDPERGYGKLEQLQADLAASRGRPVEVTRLRRAAQLAVLVIFLYVGLECMLGAGFVGGLMPLMAAQVRVWNAEEAQHHLVDAAWLHFAVDAASPAPMASLSAAGVLDDNQRLSATLPPRIELLKRERQARLEGQSFPTQLLWQMMAPYLQRAADESMTRQRQEHGWWLVRSRWRAEQVVTSPDPIPDKVSLIAALILLTSWPVLWVAWAFLFRGGISFWLMSIRLACPDGAPAERWQCAGRALVVWLPVTALLAASLLLDAWHWMNWTEDHPQAWISWVSVPLWWAGWLLLASYIVLALWRPQRALHDQLAGTYLVPR
jgi:hypothetical protein